MQVPKTSRASSTRHSASHLSFRVAVHTGGGRWSYDARCVCQLRLLPCWCLLPVRHLGCWLPKADAACGLHHLLLCWRPRSLCACSPLATQPVRAPPLLSHATTHPHSHRCVCRYRRKKEKEEREQLLKSAHPDDERRPMLETQPSNTSVVEFLTREGSSTSARADLNSVNNGGGAGN